MKTDFNFGSKLIFRKRMISNLEAWNMLPEEHFGSRKKHSATEIAFNRRLIADLAHQKKRNIIIIGADAAHCYDRIAHVFIILACRSIKIPLAVLLIIFETIQYMQMNLCTGFEESKCSYGGDHLHPL